MTTLSVPNTDALSALVAGLPRDQALGLRLIGLARAAAACHMSQASHGARFTPEAHERAVEAGDAQVLRSQAAGLVAAMSERGAA